MSQGKLRSGFVSFVLIVLVIIGTAVFYYAVKSGLVRINLDDLTVPESSTATDVNGVSPTSTQKYENTIKLPQGMRLNDDYWTGNSINIRTQDEVKRAYNEIEKKGGCGGMCSYLLDDKHLEEQFEVLSDIAGSKDCKLTTGIEKKIRSFYLFDAGISPKPIVDVIWNDNLKTCGVKFVGPDGYDAWLGNFEYEAGFIKDNKIIEIRFELFPLGVYAKVDKLWMGFGYQEGACDAVCYEKQLKYMENINYQDDLIQFVIGEYDTAVKTFKLN